MVLPPPPIAVPIPEAKPVQPEAKPEILAAAAPAPEIKPDPSDTPPAAVAPPSKTDGVHVQVDVPMVYSADSAAIANLGGAPVLAAPDAMYLPAPVYMALFRPVLDTPTVTPLAPAKAQREKKGFFGRLKSFF